MSIKTKSAKYAKMQRGEYQSKICPYGYRKSADGRMEPDPEAAEVVRLIFELSANGVNATDIARELYRRGIPTPGEYKAMHGNHTHDVSRTHGVWSCSTILRMLEDERYTLKIQMEVFLLQDGAVSSAGIITERPAYEQQIETLVNEKMRLYESYQMGENELADYKARKEILDAELLKAKNAYAALTAQAKRDQEAQARKAERRSISKELSAADGLTAELVGLLIDKVYVFPNKRIEIAYKVKDFIA